MYIIECRLMKILNGIFFVLNAIVRIDTIYKCW